MKKLISAILVLAMVVVLPISVAATTVTGGTTSDVKASYSAQSASVVRAVTISWAGMEFVYNDEYKGDWNTENYVYENARPASWSGSGTITVTNHSNVAVVVKPSFAAETGYGEVGMKFSSVAVTVASADNGSNGAAGTPVEETITVTATGSLPQTATTKTKVGTITLEID